jgi:DeoR/GlpR family transcriptional regulator of sugar metabolism
MMQYVNESTKHRLIGLGGDYVTRYQAFLGIVCEQAITNVYADVLLASCSAVRGVVPIIRICRSSPSSGR